MTRVLLTKDDLAHSRFGEAPAPLVETVMGLVRLRRGLPATGDSTWSGWAWRAFPPTVRPLWDLIPGILDENHVYVSAEGMVLSPISLRLAHPPEFGLMARIAGLRLRERWGGWNGEPFTAASRRHVSVYERSPDR